jgi:hypothetical protein
MGADEGDFSVLSSQFSAFGSQLSALSNLSRLSSSCHPERSEAPAERSRRTPCPTAMPAARRRIFDHLLLRNRLAGECYLPSPLFREILPSLVSRLDQRDLLRPAPALQLLLTIDCLPYVIKPFVIHQARTVIFARESLELAALVLKHSPLDVVGHADVQRPAEAGDNLSPIGMVHAKNIPEASGVAVGYGVLRLRSASASLRSG